MSNHTPGPWDTRNSDSEDSVCRVACGLSVVAIDADPTRHDPDADARLIADAPDFLETLKMCVAAMKSGMVDFNPYDEYVLQRAESLIEKHEGYSDA